MARVPHFPHLDEDNVRQGFVDDARYARLAFLCEQEGLWMRAMFEVGYCFGWRVSEIQKLKVRQVDLAARILAPRAGNYEKSGWARSVYPTAPVSTHREVRRGEGSRRLRVHPR